MSGDYYGLLGVTRTASPQEVRKAYLKLARRYHPDRHDGDHRATAEQQMQTINEAWNTLSDPEKRRSYDVAQMTRQREDQQARSAGNGAAGSRGHGEWVPFDDTPDPDRDFDPRPIKGSATVPRWLIMTPAVLAVIGVGVVGFGTIVSSAAIFGIGVGLLIVGAVSFVLLPLLAMSRAERDPKL